MTSLWERQRQRAWQRTAGVIMSPPISKEDAEAKRATLHPGQHDTQAFQRMIENVAIHDPKEGAPDPDPFAYKPGGRFDHGRDHYRAPHAAAARRLFCAQPSLLETPPQARRREDRNNRGLLGDRLRAHPGRWAGHGAYAPVASPPRPPSPRGSEMMRAVFDEDGAPMLPMVKHGVRESYGHHHFESHGGKQWDVKGRADTKGFIAAGVLRTEHERMQKERAEEDRKRLAVELIANPDGAAAKAHRRAELEASQSTYVDHQGQVREAPVDFDKAAEAIRQACVDGDSATIAKIFAEPWSESVDLNLRTRYRGPTPLMEAARSGHAECVLLLLDKGANHKAQDAKGDTALSLASWKGHAPAVAALCAGGADVDYMDKDGWTALMGAASSGNLATVNVLLKAGAEVNLQNKHRLTAVKLAATEGNQHAVVALLNAGAVLSGQKRARDKRGKFVKVGLAGNRPGAMVRSRLQTPSTIGLGYAAMDPKTDDWGKMFPGRTSMYRYM